MTSRPGMRTRRTCHLDLCCPRAVLCAVLASMLLAGAAHGGDESAYQSTRLLELRNYGRGFCFVVQVGDLAYVASSGDRVPSNLVIGDEMRIRIKGDHIFLTTGKTWKNGFSGRVHEEEIKSSIGIRKRMTGATNLPSCSFPVSVH
jgi:hypothetical protein